MAKSTVTVEYLGPSESVSIPVEGGADVVLVLGAPTEVPAELGRRLLEQSSFSAPRTTSGG